MDAINLVYKNMITIPNEAIQFIAVKIAFEKSLFFNSGKSCEKPQSNFFLAEISQRSF